MAFEHYDKCSLLLPMDGANNGTTFTDWSPSPKTVTVAGNAKTVTAQSKYYGSSGYFDGAGDYLSAADSSYLQLSGDFTIAIWARFSNVSGTGAVVAKGVAGSSGFSFSLNNSSKIAAYITNLGAVITSTSSISSDTWYHLVLTRASGTLRLFINGILESSVSNSTDLSAVGSTLTVGLANDGTSYHTGYIQDLLIIKGAALWTSDFEPPSRLVGTISGEVRDKDNAPASRIVTAFPRTAPTKLYQTASSAVDGTFSLRLPATESTALVMANESVMRNDIVDRIIPE